MPSSADGRGALKRCLPVNSEDKLVMMANQIAANLATEADPVSATLEHIRLFWDPHMRGMIKSHKSGLSPVARAAIEGLD